MINFITILSILIFLFSCSDDIQKIEGPYTEFSGVTTYDENGTKVNEVDSDWYPECYEIIGFEGNHLCFYATYPLPANDTITLDIASAINGEIKLWLSLTEGIVEKEVYSGHIREKVEKIKIPFDEENLYRNVVYRLFVETKDTSNGESMLYYGDILWKNQ
ncbi:MAG: hypothetical protein ACE364_04270 [Chlorobiota bacterium]